MKWSRLSRKDKLQGIGLILLGLLTAIIFALFMTSKDLPQIELPKAMQHNTIGELPI